MQNANPVCTGKLFLTVSLWGICYVWTQTQTKVVEFSYIQLFLSNVMTLKVTLCMPQQNWNRIAGENLFPLSERVRVQGVSSSRAVCGWHFSILLEIFSKNPLPVKVARQLLNCIVTFSSRKYSESYQMLLGAQHGTSLSSSVMAQLFPHGGILAILSILRTRKNI